MRIALLGILLALTVCAVSMASPFDNMGVDEIRAHPDFVSDNQSMSWATNSGDPDAPHIYEWIGYIPHGDTRVYFTSYGEPLTCVQWSATGEWVPRWVVDALDNLYERELITIPDGWEEPREFSLSTPAGQEKQLSALLGKKPVVVNFWADWCPPCVAELPHFEEVYHEHDGEFELYAVAVASSREPAAFFKEHGFSFPLMHDGNGAETYEVTGIPTTLFISETGRVVEVRVGGMSLEMFEEKLARILR